MNIRSFADIEEILSSKRPDIKTVNWFFALEDMKKFMDRLGTPQDKYSVIHVAGTSGKTSTSYYLAKMLELAGVKTGLTVSPHVDKINERVQIDGEVLSEQQFLSYFQEFIDLPEVQSMEITYFGLLVAFAYWVFAKEIVSYAVIEVGMGGKLDATNVINSPNKVCVITDIGLDHTKFLGNSLSEIAQQKAGIIQSGQQVFVAEQDTQVMTVFKRVAKSKNADLHIMPEKLIALAPDHLPPFQKRNWSLAKFAFDFIAERDGLDIEITKERISADIVIPARMEELNLRNKIVIIDGSHNAQKITALVEGVQQKHPDKKVATLIAMVDGKDESLQESLVALKLVSDKLIVTEFTGTQDVYRKAIKTGTVSKQAKIVGFNTVVESSNPNKAFDILLSQAEDVLLVTGSFFLLNHIRPLLTKSAY